MTSGLRAQNKSKKGRAPQRQITHNKGIHRVNNHEVLDIITKRDISPTLTITYNTSEGDKKFSFGRDSMNREITTELNVTRNRQTHRTCNPHITIYTYKKEKPLGLDPADPRTQNTGARGKTLQLSHPVNSMILQMYSSPTLAYTPSETMPSPLAQTTSSHHKKRADTEPHGRHLSVRTRANVSGRGHPGRLTRLGYEKNINLAKISVNPHSYYTHYRNRTVEGNNPNKIIINKNYNHPSLNAHTVNQSQLPKNFNAQEHTTNLTRTQHQITHEIQESSSKCSASLNSRGEMSPSTRPTCSHDKFNTSNHGFGSIANEYMRGPIRGENVGNSQNQLHTKLAVKSFPQLRIIILRSRDSFHLDILTIRNNHEHSNFTSDMTKPTHEPHKINKSRLTLHRKIIVTTGTPHEINVRTRLHQEHVKRKWADSIGQSHETPKNFGQSQHSPHQVPHQPFVNRSSAPSSHRKTRSYDRFLFPTCPNQEQMLWVEIPPVSFDNIAHPHGCNSNKLKQQLGITLTSMPSIENLLTIPLPITSSFEGKDKLKMAIRLLNEMKAAGTSFPSDTCRKSGEDETTVKLESDIQGSWNQNGCRNL